MSHFTTIQTQLRDMTAIQAACRELGFPCDVAAIGQKVKARGYAGNLLDCDAVIRLPGPYDVALTRGSNGNYEIVADYYRGHVAQSLGPNCQKLIQRYGVVKATQAARLKGYAVQRVNGKNGAINLVISGGAM